MTILISLAVVAALIATFVGYIAWRDRRDRGSVVDPSNSREEFSLTGGETGRAVGTRITKNLPASRAVLFHLGS